MAVKIDNKLLANLGLGDLSAAEKKDLIANIQDTLEMRVGTRLAEQMTQQQIEEFERIFDEKDEDAALDWLTAATPDYEDVVDEEFTKLQLEVRKDKRGTKN